MDVELLAPAQAEFAFAGSTRQAARKGNTMKSALQFKATVLPGGKIEVADQLLPIGEEVEVIVLLPMPATMPRRSAVDILAEAPGHRLFKTAADVKAYLQQEHEAWDR
jgi:hypothetical protein